VAGLAAAFGSGAMTNTIACVEEADVILITGSNTTENHPVMSAGVKRAVESGRARLIVVDPRRIKICRICGALSAAQPGYGCGLDQRHDARHYQGGSPRQAVCGRPHRKF
jgi:predicted molibdopterin-dependent oxidoreductase YjgC